MPDQIDSDAEEQGIARPPAVMPVADAYEAWAATYDLDRNMTRDLDAVVLRETALPLDGASVVEFGAGTGKNTAYLASRAAAVTALDLSRAMLARAAARVPATHVRFVQHDIREPWPVADGAADLVVGNLVLEHVADLGPVLLAARRALKRGGQLVLCELHPYRQWRGAGAKFEGAAGEQRVEVYTHRIADYIQAAGRAGFSLLSLQEVNDPGHAQDAPPLPRLLQIIFRTTD